MAKYDPLRDYLLRQSAPDFMLSFREIERIVGTLPTSALRPQWWANNVSPNTSHVPRRAWADAGYNAFLYAGRKVRFKKIS